MTTNDREALVVPPSGGSHFGRQDEDHGPDGGFHLVRDYGWCSNKMRGQRARRAGHVRNGDGADAPEPPSRASAHWQRLIRKVYEAAPREDFRFSMEDRRMEPGQSSICHRPSEI